MSNFFFVPNPTVTTSDYTTAGTFSWTCPQGVTEVLVECWGGGGGGGAASVRSTNASYAFAGGGGGGAFASSIIAVVPGTEYSVVVGAAGPAGVAPGAGGTPSNGGTGGNSTFNTTSVIAAGGSGGGKAYNTTQYTYKYGTAGAGGTVAASTGTTEYAGGNGAAGSGTGATAYSGGGGGGAGTTGAGGNASTYIKGTGTTVGGGNGGNGNTPAGTPGAGSAYGGGGAGGAISSNLAYRNGAAGARGRVRLTYTNTYTHYIQHWDTNPHSVVATTVNSVGSSVINVTSTSIDPWIDMASLGSFDPNIYKFILIRYKVISGAAGAPQIFFYNSAGGASADRCVTDSSAYTADGSWHVKVIDMSSHAKWLDSNITGWRFDWTTTNTTNIKFDYICLSESPIPTEFYTQWIQHWNTNPYGVTQTTVNSVGSSVINVTATGIDPNIDMASLGSFDPSLFKYLIIKYRFPGGSPVSAPQIFFYNAAGGAAGDRMVGGSDWSSGTWIDATWQIMVIDMSSHAKWLDSNITGWRFDWTGTNGANMEFDYIRLTDNISVI